MIGATFSKNSCAVSGVDASINSRLRWAESVFWFDIQRQHDLKKSVPAVAALPRRKIAPRENLLVPAVQILDVPRSEMAQVTHGLRELVGRQHLLRRAGDVRRGSTHACTCSGQLQRASHCPASESSAHSMRLTPGV